MEGNDLTLVSENIWVIYAGVLVESEPWYVYSGETKAIKVRGKWAKVTSKAPIILLNGKYALLASYDEEAP